MVEALILYAIFALTTSLTGYVTLIRPALERLKHEQPLHDMAQAPIMSAAVFIIMGFLVAPIIIFPTLFPGAGKKFQNSFYNTITE